jgi:dystrophin
VAFRALQEEYNRLRQARECRENGGGPNGEGLLVGGSGGLRDDEMLAEAKLLRQHKNRLEARMRILEDHNTQLEAQLSRLRQLLDNVSTQIFVIFFLYLSSCEL